MIDWILIFHVAAGVVLGVGLCRVISAALSAGVLILKTWIDGRHKQIRVPRYGRNPDT